MNGPGRYPSSALSTATPLRAGVWLLVLALLVTRVVWLPAHMAFVPHCPPSAEQHAHDGQGHCADGHDHDPGGDHQCHTAAEHELAMAVQRGEVDLEPAGMATPAVAPQHLRSILLARRALGARSSSLPDLPPPGARRGRAPPA